MTKKKQTPADLLAIDASLSDTLMFQDIKDSKVGELIDEKDPATEACVQDVFSSLYLHDPQVRKQAPTAQKGLVDQLMKLPEYKQLRSMTRMDEISSAFGTLQLAPAMKEQLKQIQEKMQEKDREIPKSGQGSGPAGEVTLDDILSDEEMAGLRAELREASQKAQEDSEKWDGLAGGWGIDPAELKQMPFENRMDLAERLMQLKQFERIADLAGRFKNVVNSAAAITPSHGHDEIVDIRPGSDIARLLPSELLKLKSTPKLFFKDLMENNLMCYNLRGVENLGRGPIIMCEDHSGSMGGSRSEWAKAVAIAMMGLADKQKRAFGYLAFNSRVMFQKYFPKGQRVSTEAKLEIASLGPSGGTDFYSPLKAAFEMRIKDPDLKPADIIFITDGDCSLSDQQLTEIQKLKDQTHVRIFGIAICDSSDSSVASGPYLSKFCDQIAVVNSLGEIQAITEMVRATAADQKRK